MKKANRIFTTLVFLFLYIPMIVLIVASFNAGRDIATFEGFTLRQYAELFRDEDMLRLLPDLPVEYKPRYCGNM